MDRGEKGMNPEAVTIVSPRKEYWPSRVSNQQPPVLKSAMLQTELWDSAALKKQFLLPKCFLLFLSFGEHSGPTKIEGN